jgi:AbrB family looped-hinge helix DNA binding protein
MRATITIDKAGRVVLPKAVRDQLHLMSGDALELHSDGEKVTLQPVRAASQMVRKSGVWILRGGDPVGSDEVVDWIRQDREERDRKNMGLEN